jgi:hypothetical protein
MKITDYQVEELINQCINFVETSKIGFFKVTKMKKNYGLCRWIDILLDYRRDLPSTSFHEIIHALYPDWSETKVKYAEKRVINQIDTYRLAYFLKILHDKIFKYEKRKLTEKVENF